ncbi:MAG: hypothetical protein ABW321_22170, partial [Polyangiales bacterium]
DAEPAGVPERAELERTPPSAAGAPAAAVRRDPTPADDPDEAPQQPAAVAALGEAPVDDPMTGERGPVEEYRSMYERETRDADAQKVEATIRSAFAHAQRPDLFQSASCRANICKVLLHWSPELARDYIQSVTWLGVGSRRPHGEHGFDAQLALAPVSAKDSQGSRLVELYLKRLQPTAAK